jgi:ATP/maltotriose-dependent transcriptional regulator MalT
MTTTKTGATEVDRSAATRPVILEAKLARPRARSEHVARPDLRAVLAEGITRPLTLLAAPPGFGKTTLLAEWAEATAEPAVAWLSLDDDDNDPARFFAYVVAALRTVQTGIGGHALAAQATPGAGLVEVVLPLFLNDLAVLEQEIALVLDDYHLITNTEVHEAVAYLLGRLPPSLRLVVATREDPPLPLGRLRARGELAEVRAGELRFSDAETTAFLNDALDLDLPVEDVGLLHARTEGWPAALYLAALSLRGRDDRSALIATFAGDDRHLVDYLSAEVLASQPPELRSFLLRTSILTRFCAPLCDAVAGRDDSASLLVELERSNLLLIPLDTKREWYRYHQLFAELLRHELIHTEKADVTLLHHRASGWYREAGLIVDAANHANAAGDVGAAVELVGRHYSFFLGRGELATVERWLEALPESVIAEDWLLCFAAAMVTSHSGRLDEAERWLELAERAPPLVRNGQAPDGPVAALEAYLLLLRGDVGAAIAAARRALTAAPAADRTWLGSQTVLAAALWWSEELTEAKAVASELARAARTAELSSTTIFALGVSAAVELDQDDAAAAEVLAREASELSSHAELDEHPFTAVARIVLGRTRGRRGELNEAAAEIERGIQLAERVRAWHIVAYGLLALAEIRQAEHEPAAARRLLTRVRETLETLPDPGAGPARLERTEKLLRLKATREPSTGDAPFWELSVRELDVLRMLGSRLSQRDIAAELYVSLNTLKTHTRAIFRKLGVASRAEAVARGRELGLL